MLQDLLRNPQETEEFTAELNKILDKAFHKDPTVFHQKDPVDGNTLLLAALEGSLLDVVKKIGILVKKKDLTFRKNLLFYILSIPATCTHIFD